MKNTSRVKKTKISKTENKKICVFSTYANDRVYNQKNELVSSQLGGPGFFIKNALRNNSVPFEIFSRDIINVEILLTTKGEFGRIPQKPSVTPIPRQKQNWIIISTILDEWNLFKLKVKENQKIFVDIQGYVRNGNDFGQKKIWGLTQETLKNIFCLKGTKKEMKYIHPDILQKQKEKILIVTDGKNGVKMYNNNVEINIQPKEIIKPVNTIGAGDTLFANFVAALYKGKTANNALQIAVNKTTSFLKKKH